MEQHGIDQNIILDFFTRKEDKEKKLQQVKVFIIDEISQLNSQLFIAFDYLLRLIRKNNNYFGSLQMILCGDFMQLPPVDKEEKQQLFLFNTKAFKEGIKIKACLQKNFRQQKDQQFDKVLDEIRENRLSWESVIKLKECEIDQQDLNIQQNLMIQKYEQDYQQEINKLYQSAYKYEYLIHQTKNIDQLCYFIQQYKKINIDIKLKTFKQIVLPIRIYSANYDVNQYNNYMVRKLRQKLFNFKSCDRQMTEQFGKPERNLIVCKDAQVMISSNLDQNSGLINGVIGTIVDIYIPYEKKLKYNPIQKYYEYQLETNDFDKQNNNIEQPIIYFQIKDQQYQLKPIINIQRNSKRFQFPLQLAYGITIHKSQGQTLEQAVIDIGDCFQDGQVYVALSRVKDFKGLKILNFNKDKITSNEQCQIFIQQLINNKQKQ